MNNILSCLHPKTVTNPYTKELVTVPCGECEYCQQHKASRLASRLKFERMSWKYCVFATLTYDNNHLPLLQRVGDELIDFDSRSVHPIKGVKRVSISETYHRYSTSQMQRGNCDAYMQLCTSHFGGVPYLSTVDCQRFMKRLRQKIHRKFNKDIAFNEKNTPTLRYFICGEYGETTLRPHYHILLFFSSEFVASHIEEYIRESWQFGNINIAFVPNDCSQYVSEYCTSLSSLPIIYKNGEIRPFSLYSKHPALGTLVFSSENLKAQFLSCSCTQSFIQTAAKLPLDVRLWRTFENQLYPKLAFTSELSPADRSILYRVCSRERFKSTIGNLNAFKSYVSNCSCSVISDYYKFLNSPGYKGDFLNGLYRWFSISKRIDLQSQIFNITPREYVKCIEKYYTSKDYQTLVAQFHFEEDYTKKQSAVHLLGLDAHFLESIRDCSLGDLDATELLYIQSFKDIDINKFFSDDVKEREQYQALFDLHNTPLFRLHYEDTLVDYNNNKKSKKKNDYLTKIAQSELDLETRLFYDELGNMIF